MELISGIHVSVMAFARSSFASCCNGARLAAMDNGANVPAVVWLVDAVVFSRVDVSIDERELPEAYQRMMRPITEQAILDQYADILRLRNRFTFDCAEWDVANDELIRTHSNAGDNSGGEQEKLMTCRQHTGFRAADAR